MQTKTIFLGTAILTFFIGLVATLWFIGKRESYIGTLHGEASPTNKAKLYSIREGSTIRLKPSEAKFSVPESWLQAKNNIHLSREQIEKVQSGKGEWDTEYAQVVNNVFPYELCAAHVGSEGWGNDSQLWSDLQVRVYVLDSSPNETFTRIIGAGLKTAFAISKDASLNSDINGPWQKHTISYSVFYDDYGGTANIDFYYRAEGDKTVTFVFMHAWDHKDTIEQILTSFAWNGRS